MKASALKNLDKEDLSSGERLAASEVMGEDEETREEEVERVGEGTDS